MKTILVDAWNTFVTEEWINQDMKSMLDKFSNKKIILTNADEKAQEELWLINLPYEIFTLSFNPLKTDPRFYQIFLEKHDLRPIDVIYFEHNIDAVNSARSIWINTFHYNKDEKNIEKVEKFLNSNI